MSNVMDLAFEQAKALEEQNDKKKELQQKERFVKERRTERQYQAEIHIEKEMELIAEVSPSEQNDVFATYAQAIFQNYKRAHEQDTAALKASTPFIHPSFNNFFKLVPGQLVTVAAYTGRGKSTSVVNAATTHIEAGKRAYIISNEEAAKDMYDMVACLMEGIDHQHLVNRNVSPDDVLRVSNRVRWLLREKKLFVIDCELSNNGTTKAEYILKLLECWNLAEIQPDIVLIDYLTNIHSAGTSSLDNHYYQLEKFLTDLKNLINLLAFPVVMTAQMHSDDKKKGANSLDTKLIMGGAVQRYSTIVIEVKTDYDAGTSDYVLHKNRRFKKTGSVTLKYKAGRMVQMSADEEVWAKLPKAFREKTVEVEAETDGDFGQIMGEVDE